MKPRPKLANVMQKIRECLDADRYFFTFHGKQRAKERKIPLPHMLHVLRHGYHEKRKDEYKAEHNDWTYAIRGMTVDRRELRIAVAFDDLGMLIVTLIELTRDSKL